MKVSLVPTAVMNHLQLFSKENAVSIVDGVEPVLEVVEEECAHEVAS